MNCFATAFGTAAAMLGAISALFLFVAGAIAGMSWYGKRNTRRWLKARDEIRDLK